MPSTAASAALKRLAADAETIYHDGRLSGAQKNARLEAIQSKIKTLQRADTDYRSLASSGDEAGVVGGPGNGFGARVGNAPALRLDEPSLKALFHAAESRQSLAVKATVGTTNVDPSTYPHQLLPPVAFVREPTRVADLLPATAVDRGVIEYYVSTGTAGAAVVAEAAVKPSSNISYTRRNAVAVKIAHWAQASDEALTDFPAFAGLLTTDMTAGVIAAENAELLNGIGTGGHMFGLLNTSGVLTRAQGTSTDLDAIELAITDLRAGSRFAEPDGMVMAPGTFSRLRVAKDSQGRYLAADPVNAGSLDLWGTPVTVTTTCPANVVLVGAFKEACVLFVRESVSVRTSSGGDSFRSNLLDVVAEERIALAVTAPAALCKVTLT